MARDDLSGELRKAWELVLEEIEDVRRTTVEHDIPLLLVIAPYRFQLAEPAGKRQPLRQAFC